MLLRPHFLKTTIIINSSITRHRRSLNALTAKKILITSTRDGRTRSIIFSINLFSRLSCTVKLPLKRIFEGILLFCFADRAPRQSGGPQQPLVIWLQPGSGEDLSNLPLPDLVQSAVDQLPPLSPQVTVSVPSSPMRDATFQFPECNVNGGGVPLPSPRPRPRRRFASESSVMETGPAEVSNCNGSSCCCHLGQIINERQSWTSVGTNLRSIAGDFHACRTKVSA